MKLAMLSDLHANMLALSACLQDAHEQGVDQWAILGDLVGYGAQPSEVVARIQELAQTQGAIVLRGNHEELALLQTKGESLGAQTAAWTQQQLSPEQCHWLGQLPWTKRWENALLVHASAHEPARWHYVDNERRAAQSLDAATQDDAVRYVFGGHVHHQTLYYRSGENKLMAFKPTPGVAIPVEPHRRWVATIGSVGQPRDGDTRAAYAIFDSRRRTLCFRRVAYDHMRASQLVIAAGLPSDVAKRLEIGR